MCPGQAKQPSHPHREHSPEKKQFKDEVPWREPGPLLVFLGLSAEATHKLVLSRYLSEG